MKRMIIVLVVIAILGAAAFAIFGGNDSSNNSQANTSPSQNTSPANSSSASQAPSTDKISISNFAFTPSQITVKKGTKVTWTNNDSVTHQIAADSGNGPSSDPLSNGQSYSFTYNSIGTFAYHCTIHPEMHGTVTVTE